MRVTRKTIFLFLILYLCWFLFHTVFTWANIISGIIICSIVTYLAKDMFFYRTKHELPSMFQILLFFINVLFAAYQAAFQVIKIIIAKNDDLIVFPVKLNTSNNYITALIANSITFTPGTITLDKKENELLVLSIKNDGAKGKFLAEEIKNKLERYFN